MFPVIGSTCYTDGKTIYIGGQTNIFTTFFIN